MKIQFLKQNVERLTRELASLEKEMLLAQCDESDGPPVLVSDSSDSDDDDDGEGSKRDGGCKPGDEAYHPLPHRSVSPATAVSDMPPPSDATGLTGLAAVLAPPPRGLRALATAGSKGWEAGPVAL